MNEQGLKALENLGAELGAAKAEVERLKSLMRQAIPCLAMSTNSHAASYVRQFESALSQQPEPTDTFTAVDMATAAAQDEREAFIQRMIEERDITRRLAEYMWDHRPAQTEQQPVAIANKGEHAFWVRWTDEGRSLRGHGIKLYAAPVVQTAPAQESEHHARLLGQALGECIAAAGIIRPDASLSGPELLMFADDLKRHLAEQTAPQPEQSGLVGQVCGGDSQHNTVNVAVVGTVPWNDLPLGTPVRLIRAPALSAQGAGDANS